MLTSLSAYSCTSVMSKAAEQGRGKAIRAMLCMHVTYCCVCAM